VILNEAGGLIGQKGLWMQRGPLSSIMKIIIIVVAVIVVLCLLAILFASIVSPMGA
jgi:hypothetical protein